MTGSVVVGLRRPDGAYLWQLRDSGIYTIHPDRWSLITGAVEKGENPRQTAKRELFEEAGYAASEEELTFVCQMEKRDLFLVHYNPEQEINCGEGREMRFIQPKHTPRDFIRDQIICVDTMEGMLSIGSKERMSLVG